ncbi:sugar efflux transporter [Saccharothrix sp. S26]|uniref:sugar efflux transporter n=1 Tax=Saccharothrix sp. S26 TaxID=2907215 RepID=UPI001F40D6B7|nr:sugar efflux transporter [Saccharothrix sp. S26]MCE6994687.1 sugar efflux transporter [Saccharothrix sp. S26]
MDLAGSRTFVPLLAVSLLTGVGYALAGPFLSAFLIKDVAAGPVAVGGFLLSGSVAALVVGTVIGRLSDARAVRREVIVWGSVAATAAYGLFAVTRDYWLLLAVSLTLVAVSSSLAPQTFAYARQVVERSGSTKGPLAVSVVRTVVSVSWVVGPPVGALLIDTRGFAGLFAVAAGLYLAAALVTFASLPELGGGSVPVVSRDGSPRRVLVSAAVAFVLLQSADVLGLLVMPLYVTDVLHGTTSDAGLVMGLCAALEIPLMPAFGALALRIDHGVLVLAGGVVALLYYAALLLTTATWQVAAVQVLHAIVISAVMGVGISYFQGLAPDRPGYATTLYTNTLTISAMVSGPLLGVAQAMGYRSAFAIASVLTVFGLALLLVTGRARRGAPDASRPTGS